MKDVVIRVNNISKEFAIKGSSSNLFSALRDISFDVHQGEVLSIIGNNGSGKSTLLRILSSVTAPSRGEILLYGSCTSILDIGGNFHPDLTGRENVLLQLKLAGKKKTEFDTLISQILDFSEIGDFIDQAVKHYSSGMFLRLAFSLAFHVASDLLILDEVLSVGDEGFRLKCQELLKKFAESGKTIVFVSHNRQEILELSTRCIWLEKGEIKKLGSPGDILGEYFANHLDKHERKKRIISADDSTQDKSDGVINMRWREEDAPKDENVSIREVRVHSGSGGARILNSDPIHLSFILNKRTKGAKIGAFFFLQDVFYQSVMVGHMLNDQRDEDISTATKDMDGMVNITCIIPADFLIPGKYYLQLRFGMEENAWNTESKELFRFFEKLSFTVYADSRYTDFIGDISKGSFRPRLEWKVLNG